MLVRQRHVKGKVGRTETEEEDRGLRWVTQTMFCLFSVDQRRCSWNDVCWSMATSVLSFHCVVVCAFLIVWKNNDRGLCEDYEVSFLLYPEACHLLSTVRSTIHAIWRQWHKFKSSCFKFILLWEWKDLNAIQTWHWWRKAEVLHDPHDKGLPLCLVCKTAGPLQKRATYCSTSNTCNSITLFFT